MLYEDAESEVITPEEVMDLMEEDTKAADLILWVGISFQQSASTAYFRKVRHWLQEAGKSEHVVQAVINPSDEALWNLMTASSNQQELNVVEVLASSDEVLPVLARHVTGAGATARGGPIIVQEAVQILEKEQEDTEVLMSRQEDTNAAPIENGLFSVFNQLEEEEEGAVPSAGLAEGKEEKEEEEALAAVAMAAVHATKIEDVAGDDMIGGDKVRLNAVQGIAVENDGDNKLQGRTCSPPQVET
ncbi:hypothetical protein Ndes2526A_g02140 [Nannochloris sp. 'desiccata']|nr:hypothetical protein KSW81_003481 [Chlorella desiccata (nom. nud.)]